MMGKINQRYPYSLRVSLLAAMDLKTAQRGFTSWDRDNVGEHVIPLVLGARPGTRDFWNEFRNRHLDVFEGLPQATLRNPPPFFDNGKTRIGFHIAISSPFRIEI